MLPFYADHFRSTEINYSFRRIPSEKTLSAWAAATPPKFKFSFKAPQRITHFARLKDCSETLHFFTTAIVSLGPKLGPVLFQLPPQFECDADRLRSFLGTIPSQIQAAFEFRHASWFNEGIYSILREHHAALCLAESEELATPPVATAPFGYLRLRREDYSAAQITRWAKLIEGEASWHTAFIYFKHEEGAVGPKFAKQMLNDLNQAFPASPRG